MQIRPYYLRKFSLLRKCLFLRNVHSCGMFVSEEDSCLGKGSIRRFEIASRSRSQHWFLVRWISMVSLIIRTVGTGVARFVSAVFCLPQRRATVIGFEQAACFDSWDCRRSQGLCLFSRKGDLFGQLCGSNHLFRVHRFLMQLDIRRQTHYNCAFNVIVRNVTERFFYFLHLIDMLKSGFFFGPCLPFHSSRISFLLSKFESLNLSWQMYMCSLRW